MSTSEEDNVYNVEEIVGHRRNNGREEYLIKWEGYPEEENTWEPVSNLDKGSLKMAQAYHSTKQKELQSVQQTKVRTGKLKRKRRQVILDSDDEFISNVDDSHQSDGTQSDDGSRKESIPVTPSPPQRSRISHAERKERIRRTIQEKYGEGIVTQSIGARRNILYDESDDSDTEGGNENGSHPAAKLPHLPLLPSSQPNLSSSPTKLKTTTLQCDSSIDALTKKRLPYQSRKPHVCFTDSDGDRYCYALDTLYRVAIEKHIVGQKLTFLQPPHFDSPMSEDLEDQIACRFGRQALKIENSKNYHRYYERFVLGMGSHDLYCCPICYNEASRGRASWWVDDNDDDDDDDENSDEEDKEDCFSFDDDPMTILENVGSSVSSTFCFLKVKGVRMHLQDVHSVNLGDLRGNDLFKRFKVRSPDGLLQHYVGSHHRRAGHGDMQSYWHHDQNNTSFRDLVQLIKDSEDKKLAANRSDFCKSFPNRARKIWEKVSGPYLKDDDSTEEKKFINDDIPDEDANEVRENPYFDPLSANGEEVMNQYLAGLKQRTEQNRGSENDSSSPDESDSNESSSLEDDDSEEDEESSREEDNVDINDDSWMKEKMNKMEQKRRSILTSSNDDEDDSMFEADTSQATKCANFTASDDEE